MQRNKINRYDRIISHFKYAKILVVGDVMLDRFVWAQYPGYLRGARSSGMAKSESFMPGGASNVANNVRALGAEVHICGVIGDDEPAGPW